MFLHLILIKAFSHSLSLCHSFLCHETILIKSFLILLISVQPSLLLLSLLPLLLFIIITVSIILVHYAPKCNLLLALLLSLLILLLISFSFFNYYSTPSNILLYSIFLLIPKIMVNNSTKHTPLVQQHLKPVTSK